MTEYQSHSGLVDTSSTPAIQYNYTTTYETANTLWANGSNRLTGVTYPPDVGTTTEYQVTYGYGASGGLDDKISRIETVSEPSRTLATYQYLGLAAVAGETLPQPNIEYSDTLDNFGNVNGVWWTQVGVQNLVQFKYGYDAVGDMLYRQDALADPSGQVGHNLDQLYTYDSLHRLTGYYEGTLSLTNPAQPTISGMLVNGWNLDSEGNRYDTQNTMTGVTYGTNYSAAGQSTNSGTGYAGGDTTTVAFEPNRTVAVSYDAWGRVASTVSTPTGSGGPNAAATKSSYSYDALGRQISVINTQPSGTSTGTQSYYDGSNPVEVHTLTTGETMIRYVWSPADGRMILRDAVVAAFNTYTGLTVTGNWNSNTIQRLYPLTDALGSIVAVASPSGAVQERYTYTVDGLPQSLDNNWAPYPVSGVVHHASQLGWNWFYQGQQWVQTQPDSGVVTQWRGFYVVAASVLWYDPVHARTLQPNLSAYGDPQRPNPYELTGWERAAVVGVPIAAGAVVTLGTGGLGSALADGAMAIGGLTAGASAGVLGGLASNQSAGQIAVNTVVGGVAGGAGARQAALSLADWASRLQSMGRFLGAVGGAVTGGIQGTYQGYMQTGTPGGALEGAFNSAVTGGITGAATGALLFGGIRGIQYAGPYCGPSAPCPPGGG